ncbi:hypothetical protein K1719_042638 [Acacia pycnantha]|nr:hypothetical protein K1719_042638 [Acacia pycnantha]
MVFERPLSKYDEYNLVLHGFPNLLSDHKSWIFVNTGSFLFRNCNWSLDLLDALAPMAPKIWSAADGRVLKDAIRRPHGLRVAQGNYYLVDAGYTNCQGGAKMDGRQWLQSGFANAPQSMMEQATVMWHKSHSTYYIENQDIETPVATGL